MIWQLCLSGGSVAAQMVDEDMGVSYVDCNRLRPEDECFSDPLGGETEKPQTKRDWKLQMHPRALCQGLGTSREAYNTLTSWLQEMLDTDLTHMQLAQQANAFSLSLLAPVPFANACKAVALHEGWSKEGLWQGILANASWLECQGTVLTDQQGAEHKRAPGIPCFFGGPPSSRKSSMKKAICKTLFDHPDVPVLIREGQCIAQDATAKGIQGALQETCGEI